MAERTYTQAEVDQIIRQTAESSAAQFVKIEREQKEAAAKQAEEKRAAEAPRTGFLTLGPLQPAFAAPRGAGGGGTSEMPR